MKTIIISIVGVIIIGLIIWGMSNSQKQSAQPDADATTTQATTTQVTTGNTVTLEDNRLPPEEPVVSVRPSQGLSFQYVPMLIQTPLQLGLNESGTVGKLAITPKKIYDTRCPINTKCDEEGVARVIFGVVGPVTTKNINITEGQSLLIDNIKVTLQQVSPEPSKTNPVDDNDYVFKLLIESAQ